MQRRGFLRSRVSRGWCTPCREGVPWLENMLDDIAKGIAPENDYEKVKSI
ncbi:MAG: NADH-ubiquinone oxidoreductase-F iron-sulfur binding region domain-containing protein, partial [Halobacteria archaeon]